MAPTEEVNAPSADRIALRDASRTEPSSRTPWLLILVLILAVAGGWWYFHSRGAQANGSSAAGSPGAPGLGGQPSTGCQWLWRPRIGAICRSILTD